MATAIPIGLRQIRWLCLVLALGLGACGGPATTPSSSGDHALIETPGSPQSTDIGAVSLLQQEAAHAPRDPAAQERYALAAERAGLYPQALAAMDRANALDPSNERLLTGEGRIALEAGDVPVAVRAYSRALQVNPHEVDALGGMGIAEDLQHHHANAQAKYREALVQSPGDWGIRSNLAISLLMSNNPQDAVAALSGAEKAPSAPHRARDDLALALIAAGKRDQAVAVLRQDVPPAEADHLADEFARFAKWLASPDGDRAAAR